MQHSFAQRMNVLRASDVREILKVTQNPDMISFAGGLPAPELFPTAAMAQVAHTLLQEHGVQALQYSTTEGDPKLRAYIASSMNTLWGTALRAEEVAIMTGSQQGLDLTAKLFLDEGDVVLCESPTYIGAIMAFNAFLPVWVEIPTDDEGMDMAALGRALSSSAKVKFIYVVPNFQNPTGRTWSLERRRRLIELASRYQVPIVEDNPYGQLCFEGEVPCAIQSLDTEGLVISLGTFSKTFCPGLRIGWVAGPRPYIEKYTILKQAADLHTSTLDQMLAVAYLETQDLERDIQEKLRVYRARRDVMVHALELALPPEVTFTRPRGGLFLWVMLPEGIDARDLLKVCLDRGVAFVPGEGFFPTGAHRNALRLNFSCMPEERIEEGVARFAGAVSELLSRGSGTPAGVDGIEDILHQFTR